jgi:hypothetical protein
MKRPSCLALLLLLAAVPGFAAVHAHSFESQHQFHFPPKAGSRQALKLRAAQQQFKQQKNSPFIQFNQNQTHSKPQYHRAGATPNPPTGKLGLVSAIQVPAGGFLGFNSCFCIDDFESQAEPAVGGDFNGDGKLDAAIIVETDNSGTYGYAFSVVLSNGDGTFQAPVLTAITDSCAVLSVGDVNGDGKDDILVVHSQSQCENSNSSFDVFLSNGDGTFTQKSNYVITSNGLAGGILQDVNNDGFLDAVVVDQANPGNVWTVLGNGDGTFSNTPTSVALSGQVSDAVLADLNGDHILDVAGLDDEQVTVYLAASASSYAAGVSLITSDTNYEAYTISVGDLNNDGFPEIVTPNFSETNNNLTVYVNNKSGGFATGVYYGAANGGPSGTTTASFTTAVAIADVNGDGNPDILAANTGDNNITVLLGNGDGTVNVPTYGYSIGGFVECCPSGLTAPIVADFNGDGYSDILIADEAYSLDFAKGYGDGSFRTALQYYIPTTDSGYVDPNGIASGDFNGDGFPDIVVGSQGDTTVGISVFLSRPDGSLQPGVSYTTPSSNGYLWFVAVADFNKDGKLDIAATDPSNGFVQIFTGNGDGTFTLGSTFNTDSGNTGPQNLIAADFNGDGYPDLAVINQDASPTNIGILINDGTGNFQPAVTYPLSSSVWQANIAVGDLNGDGKLDLATPTSSSGVAMLMGNGDGTFQPETDLSLGVNNAQSVAIADLNGDKIMDLAVSLNNGLGQDIAIALGTGNAVFPTITTLAASLQDFNFISPYPLSIHVADIDNDGNPDLVYANESYGTVGILFGSGAGAFYDPVEFPSGGITFNLTLADVNQDGAVDVITTDEFLGGASVLLNANGAIGNYTITPTSQTTATVTAGSSATFTFTVTPTGHYNGTITFSCGNTPPALATCTFNPPSVTFNSASSAPVDVTLTITTTAVSASLETPHHNSSILLASLSGMGLFGMVLAGSLKKNRWLPMLLAAFVVAMIATTVGCGGASTSSGGSSTAATTTTALKSSSNTVTVGTSVTFTSTVSATSGSPTGTVTFLDGTTKLGTGTIANGTATYSTTSLAAGAHNITASYAGDSSFKSSTSSALSETVDNPGTPSGNFTVTVTATGTAGTNNGSTAAHPLNFTLTVQ